MRFPKLLFWTFLVLSLNACLHLANANRAYPLGCSHQDPSYYDYENCPFPPPGVPIKTTGDYLLVRRLGAGKFSDVFEAVDVELEQKFKSNERKSSATGGAANRPIDEPHASVTTQIPSKTQSTSKIRVSYDGNNDDQIHPDTLVVLKCLKPVSERKIKRELLVLRHASTLPNLVRLVALVVPSDYYESKTTSSSTSQQEKDSYQQAQGGGNAKPSSTSYRLQPMPTLVLEHAGIDSQWLCHVTSLTPVALPAETTSTAGRKSNTATNSSGRSDKALNDFSDEASSLYLNDYEIRFYLYHLLIALDSLHSCGIMHRDVKPRNVLINRKFTLATSMLDQASNSASSTTTFDNNAQLDQGMKRKDGPLMLIDLGLADFYLPNTRYNVRVASRHYKAPELLLGYEYYDYAIDMWGVGCILAGLLLRREPFFRGKDNLDQLGTIVAVLGTADLHTYVSKASIDVTPELRNVIAKYTLLRGGQKQDWKDLARMYLFADGKNSKHSDTKTNTRNAKNAENDGRSNLMPSPEGLDLLSKLLVYDHTQRLTAKQAMLHPFFDPVRDRIKRQFPQVVHEKAGEVQNLNNPVFK